jgi:hypothetical protein
VLLREIGERASDNPVGGWDDNGALELVELTTLTTLHKTPTKARSLSLSVGASRLDTIDSQRCRQQRVLGLALLR